MGAATADTRSLHARGALQGCGGLCRSLLDLLLWRVTATHPTSHVGDNRMPPTWIASSQVAQPCAAAGVAPTVVMVLLPSCTFSAAVDL